MTDTYFFILAAAIAVVAILQILLLLKKTGIDFTPVLQRLDSLEKSDERVERTMRDEIAKNREESAAAAREGRLELSGNLKAVGDTLNQQIVALTKSNDSKLDNLRGTIEQRLTAIQDDSNSKLEKIRSDSAASAQKAREEVTAALKSFNDSTLTSLRELGASQQTHLAGMAEQITKLIATTETKLDAQKVAVDDRLKSIQADNTQQLDKMRATVDEKLQTTLETRLSASFKLVSEQLDQVSKGLGEMQVLATGVGDLKKVLTNVKARGTWGEVQLGSMLEQVLSSEQYGKNVSTKDAGERVEFAVRLPGKSADKDEIVWLPIDAKFPVEDYQRLVEAQEKADPEAAEQAAKQLELRIKQCAKDICDKYISPPKTTDFGILYLPMEGLFAEVIRRTGLTEHVQRHCRVVIAGPTTLWSILNSLQMGFRTLAIEKRSSEVWKLLGAVKTGFGNFGDALKSIKDKLDQASNKIDEATKKSKTIERKLKDVQGLPQADTAVVLGIGSEATDPDTDDSLPDGQLNFATGDS